MRTLVFLILFLGLYGCASDSVNKPAVHYLTVLHTNDNHGRFWHNEKGEYGMAARKTLIDQLRADAKA